MFAAKFLLSAFLALLWATRAHAGTDNTGFYFTLINGTPYRWMRMGTYTNTVAGDLNGKEPWQWPDNLNSGESHETYVRWDEASNKGNGVANVTYKLVGTGGKPASFKIFASHKNKMVYAEFLEELETLGNSKGSLIKIGYQESKLTIYYPGLSFILAGEEGSYISTNPPVAWMQATLPTIGDRTLRELILPASHNSGMSKITADRGGTENLCLTQTLSIYDQLKAGIRILDIRPSFWMNYNRHPDDEYYDPGPQVRCGSMRENHIKVWIGATGLKIKDVVNQVNEFNRDFPGELILIQVKFMDWFFEDTEGNIPCSKGEVGTGPIGKKWNRLTHELKFLEHRQHMWLPLEGPGSDLGTYKIRNFIENGKSSVIVLMPKAWVDFYETPGYVNRYGIVENDDTDDWEFYFNVDQEFYVKNNRGVRPLSTKYPLDLSGVLPLNKNHTTYQKPYTIDNVTYQDNNYYVTEGYDWQGFFIHDHFCWHNEYSVQNTIGPMSEAQYATLHQYRNTPHDEPYMLKWIMTQLREETGPRTLDEEDEYGQWLTMLDSRWIDYIRTFHGYLGFGLRANGRLYDWLWRASSENTYPNGVEVDNVVDSQITALVMAMNYYYGGKGKKHAVKTDEYIRTAMGGMSELYAQYDANKTELQSAENTRWQEYLPGTCSEWKIYPWARFEGMVQYFAHRYDKRVMTKYGEIIGGDD